jgi:TRAP-type C4-dicarboxylate transport system substrate-binding protein
MKARTTRRWAMVAAVTLFVAACGGGGADDVADKSGNDTVVLRLATIDSVNNNGQSYGPQAFVDALEQVSGGRVKVEVTETYDDGAADAESNLVEAIASGELDGGWPSTRAFADAGIPGLQAVEAPMTITSYDAEKALVSGPVADELLAQLDGTGVVGLGLAVGPLRRPFAADAALVGPEDWQGARFRVYNSPVQADAVRALGGEPVNLSFEWMEDVEAGNLRGAEFDIAQYATSGFTTQAGNVTANVVLWPKVFVLSISQKRIDALSDQQREWVHEAADQAVQASVDATYDETTPARQLCDNGVRFVNASPDQMAALRSAFTPVVEQLADDPVTGPLLEQIQGVAAEHATPDVPGVPETCGAAAVPDDELGPVPEEVSSLPDGSYRVEITLADVEAAGASNGPGWTGTWTLEVSDGTYAMTCTPLDDPGRDCGNTVTDDVLEAGYLHGTGDTVYFVYDAELHSQLSDCELPCHPQPTYRVTWALDGDSLQFSDLSGSALDKVLKPWQKIG